MKRLSVGHGRHWAELIDGEYCIMNAYKTDDISIIENIAGALSRSVLSTFMLWAILFFSIGCEGVNSLNRINSNNVSDSDSGESFDTSGFDDEIVLDDTVIPLEVSSLSLTGVSLLFESSKFLYTGDDPVQKGVTEEIISPVKVAVLRGKVRDRRGRALAGVRVTIRGNAVFGYTLTRADGMFDMVVNGGSRLTVDYQKDGFISLQRSLVPVMQDYNIVEDVMMTELSSKSTVINFENSSITIPPLYLTCESPGLNSSDH